MILIIMGVSGSGKTTIGQMLADSLGWEYQDSDDYHSPTEVTKMSRGIPLTDEDRAPWLETLAGLIRKYLDQMKPMVLACSALKKDYRDQLQIDPEQVRFIFLKGSYDLILERMRMRSGHFMKANMLASQFETLEEPVNALVCDIQHSPEEITAEILAAMGVGSGGSG